MNSLPVQEELFRKKVSKIEKLLGQDGNPVDDRVAISMVLLVNIFRTFFRLDMEFVSVTRIDDT